MHQINSFFYFRTSILISVLIASALLTNGQKQSKKFSFEEKITRFGLTLDQDMLVDIVGGKNEDRNYTMGAGLFYSNNKWGNDKAFTILQNLGKLPWRSNHAGLYSHNATIHVGMTGFTPRYLKNNQTDSIYYMLNDRPFSSLTFISLQHHSTSFTRSETNQFVAGLLGLKAGGEVQAHIHRKHWFGSERDIPTGWENRISKSIEFTFLLSNKVDRLLSKKVLDSSFKKKFTSQFSFSREYRVGYLTGANAGLTMRLGWLDPLNWSSSDTYLLSFGNQKSQKEEEKKTKCEFYFQASVRPHVVLYNANLMGGLQKNFHDFNYSEIEHFIVEAFTGIGIVIPNKKKTRAFNILGYYAGRTPEFKTPLSYRNHIWGGVQLSATSIR